MRFSINSSGGGGSKMSMVFVKIHQFLKSKMAGENGGEEEESMAVEGDNRGLISGTPREMRFC